MFILSISERILFVICGLGILQGILLAALIYFHPKSDRSVNTFLAVYILCTSAVMTMPISINVVGWKNSYVLQPIPLLPGIFLYFYIVSFRKKITWRNAWPHFLVPVLFFILPYLNISRIAQLYPDAKHIPVEGMRRPLTLAIVVMRSIQQFCYFFFSLRALRSYRQSIQHLFSDTSRIDLSWAKFLAGGYLVLSASFLVIFPLMLRFPDYFDSLLLLCMSVATPYIYIATFKGITQPTIWQIQPEVTKEKAIEKMHEAEKIQIETINEEKPKLVKTGLSDDKITTVTNNILVLMEVEKMYQETELTLQQLADKLQLPTYQVSQVINEGMKKTFYDLVNGYRVQEAKRLLQDPKSINYTVLSVGFEAGFNSKTTFNTVFKKFTGYTPTEFRNRYKEVLELV